MTPRILIVDDSPSILEAMATILTARGYEVTLAEDGLAAWEHFGRDPPSMAVLDIDMPRLNGCEVCRLIKGQAETSGIPVLLVSACSEVAERAQGAGADGFLNKPFFFDELLGRVGALLGQNKAPEYTPAMD